MVSPSVAVRLYLPVEITTHNSAQGVVLCPRAGATLLVSPNAISGFGPKELVLQQHNLVKETVVVVLKSLNVVHFMVIAATTWLMDTIGIYFDGHLAQGYYIELRMLMSSLFLAHILIFVLCAVILRGKEITSTSNVEPPFNIIGLLLQPIHTPVHALLLISTRAGTSIAGFVRCISSPLSGPVAALVVRDVPDIARPVSPNSNAANYRTPVVFLHPLGPDDGHGTTLVVKNTSSAKHVVEKTVPSRMFMQNAALYSVLGVAIFLAMLSYC